MFYVTIDSDGEVNVWHGKPCDKTAFLTDGVEQVYWTEGRWARHLFKVTDGMMNDMGVRRGDLEVDSPTEIRIAPVGAVNVWAAQLGKTTLQFCLGGSGE